MHAAEAFELLLSSEEYNFIASWSTVVKDLKIFLIQKGAKA